MVSVATYCVAGASGFIGQYVADRWRQAGHDVRTIGRGPMADARWGTDLRPALEGADAVLNLAGRSVSCRYNKKNVDAMFSSRIKTTAALGKALIELPERPPLWLNASTGTIYRDARDVPQTEAAGEIGQGLSVGLTTLWEQTFFDAPVKVRKVALRMTIVLGHGGALNPLINLARLGLGGYMGDGYQKFSWIHVDDVARAIDFAIENDAISGPVNVAAPEAVTNRELMRELRDVLGRTRGVPTPAWLLELGGHVIRTEPELVLKSRWVAPEVLQKAGFEWAHPELSETLAELTANLPKRILPIQLG